MPPRLGVHATSSAESEFSAPESSCSHQLEPQHSLMCVVAPYLHACNHSMLGIKLICLSRG